MMVRSGLTWLLILISLIAEGQSFRVIGFFTAKNDQAHISFVREANKWFHQTAKTSGFTYDSTHNWNNMNAGFLKGYDIVVFLDTRPDSTTHRRAFEEYMKTGGAWIGFHFAGFALTPSAFPQDWDWYHNEFIGAGEYKSNTWRPTSAVLRNEVADHPVMKGIPATFRSQPSEWYRWKNDLTVNKDIRILASIDPSSFPLGTGPKKHEIWHEGYYPVVWTNTRYRMVYMNMGHNDIDYEGKTNKQLSSSFGNPVQDALIVNALKWLGGSRKN